jgi:fructan beta-fructosidase
MSQRRILCGFILLGVMLAGTVRAYAADDITLADFEGTDYGNWKAEGNAFGSGPAQGTLPNQMPVSGFEGKGLVNTYLDGDNATGKLTSAVFTIERPYINFLIGGGDRPGEAFVQLLVDGKAVRAATGHDDEHLTWTHWDVKDLQGKNAQVQIVDNAVGGWGHINIDSISETEKPKGDLTERDFLQDVATPILYDEAYRPQFHFSARKNWLNDPNGLVFYDGEYHLFFQHNPTGIQWGNMTWGHAASPDLVHWKQLDNALLPDRLGTIYSGSAVVDWNNTTGFQTGKEKPLIAMYTAAERDGQKYSQCIAYSNDRGRTWTKYDKNPVLPYIAPANRDPKMIWHAPTKQWIVALYLTGQDYALFSSPDLKSFTRLQNVPPFGNGECPDFYPMPVDGNPAQIKWVFSGANGRYVTGDFDGHKFVLDSPHSQPMDWGKNYYAAQTYSDIPAADGRRIQIAWMNGGVYPKMPFNQQMSFPTELKLQRFPEGLRICRTPVREIELLHSDPHEWHDLTVKPGDNPLAAIHGDLFDIRAEIEPGDATEVGFIIRGHKVAYRIADQKLTCLGGTASVPLANKHLSLQLLVDRSSLEVFANNGYVAMTSCFVPDPKNKSLEFYTVGGNAKLIHLQTFALRSAWKM